MKDIKTLLLLCVSILLIIVSLFLFWTWKYRIDTVVATVEKTQPDKRTVPDRNVNATVADSLQRFYNSVLGSINKSIDSVKSSTDSLKGNMAMRLNEFNTLKTDIGNLLKNQLSDDDIIVAKQKITELQIKITQLRLANNDIERENKRLNSLLAQLSAIPKTTTTATSTNTMLAEQRSAQRTSSAADISTSDIRLTPIMESENDKEQETIWAQQTSKFVASVAVKNNSTQNSVIEMVVVVLQPDGKVLQKSTWETGTFETSQGKKIYSYKDRSDYDGGEVKKLLFTVSSDRFQKGNYTMQVYNKGVLIARIVKSLS